MNLFSKIGRLHWPLFFVMLALCVASVFFVRSATYFSEEYQQAWLSQIFWLGIGLCAFFVAAFVDYRTWVESAWIIFAVVLVLLVGVAIFGSWAFGAKRWLRLGPIALQPSELEKVAFILMMVWLLIKVRLRGMKICLMVIGLVVPPALLILKQPDLGSASVLFPIAFMMMYVAGVKKRYLAIPLVFFALIAFYLYYGFFLHGWKIPLLHDYQIARIKVFFDPSLDPLNRGWTINQSLIAIGSGGFSGKGYMQGTQNMLGFLPRNISYTDFIFAVIGEDWGFRGGAAVILGLSMIIILSVYIASQAEDDAGALLAVGIATMLFTHFFVNIGMTIKVVPITGIPLPFISYGGTFLVICLASLGLIQSVWIHKRTR